MAKKTKIIKKPMVEWMIDDRFFIIPVNFVCEHPKLNSQNIYINRLDNQPLNISKDHELYINSKIAKVALKKKLRDEIRKIGK